jgi:hypothetical protein
MENPRRARIFDDFIYGAKSYGAKSGFNDIPPGSIRNGSVPPAIRSCPSLSRAWPQQNTSIVGDSILL